MAAIDAVKSPGSASNDKTSSWWIVGLVERAGKRGGKGEGTGKWKRGGKRCQGTGEMLLDKVVDLFHRTNLLKRPSSKGSSDCY